MEKFKNMIETQKDIFVWKYMEVECEFFRIYVPWIV